MDEEEKIVNIAILTSDDLLINNIIQYFTPFADAKICCVISNKATPESFKTIRRYNLPTYSTTSYKDMDKVLEFHNIHYIVMSGYDEKIPINFCRKYQYRIINLQKEQTENMSGISIFALNEDDGTIVFQKDFYIDKDDEKELIQDKTDQLISRYYPTVIEKFIKGTYDYLIK